MRVVLIFLAGLAVGAFARLLWPGPAGARPATLTSSASAQSATAQSQSVASQPPRAIPTRQSRSPAEQQRIEAILRKAGLFPASVDVAKGPLLSWLYVGAREEWLVKSEEYAEIAIAAGEGWIDLQYGPLFRQLGLTPKEEQEFRHTLAEMGYSRNEILALTHTRVRQKNVPTEVQAMLTESDDEFRRRLREQLGDAGFALYENYSGSLPERAELSNAFLRVSALAAPLTAGQRDALVAARQAEKAGQPAPVNLDAILSPAQLGAYRQWQAGEQVQGFFSDVVRK